MIATALAVIGAASGVYGVYQSGQQAKQQYEVQQAAFANDIQAAVTNATWKLNDDTASLNIQQQQADDIYTSRVNTVWEALAGKEEANNASSSLKMLLTSENTDADIAKMIAQSKTDIQKMVDSAQIDADYAIAQAKVAADRYTTKAAMDAVSKLNDAQSLAQFVDQDINTLTTQVKEMRAMKNVASSEEVGKQVSKMANSLAKGASASRSVMATMNKADMIGQMEERKLTSAIDRARANQTKSGQDTRTQVTTLIREGSLLAQGEIDSTTNSVQRMLSSTNVDTTAIKDNLTTVVSNVETIRDITNKGIAEGAGITNTANRAAAVAEVNATTNMKNVEDVARIDTFNQQQYQTTRGLAQSLVTQFNETGDKQQAIQGLASIANDPQHKAAFDQMVSEGTLPISKQQLQEYATQYGV